MIPTDIIPFEFQEISEVKRGGFIDDTFLHNSCQSMCYDTRNKKYIVGFAEPGNVSALIRMKDLSFRKDAIDLVVRGLPLAHCNDLVYSAEDHKIYAVGGDWWVAVVDPDTLTVEKKIPLSVVAWSLAKYENGDFFVHNGDYGYRYCHDFSSSVTVSMNDLETLAAAIPNLTGCWQGAICIDGMPYMIFNEFSLKTGKPVSFMLFSCEMGNERTIYRAGTDREIESADMVGGKMMLAYNSLYRYGGSEWDISEYFMKTVYGEIEHVEIPAGKEVQIEFAKYVPEGYQLVSANVTVRKADNSIRTLPIFIGGNCMLRIQKVVKNRIYIRSTDRMYEDLTLYVTGFCRKK